MSLVCDYCGESLDVSEMAVGKNMKPVHETCQFESAQTPEGGRHI